MGTQPPMVERIREFPQIVHGGLAAGHHRKWCPASSGPFGHFGNGYSRMRVGRPGFFHITPYTAHVTAAQAKEISGAPLVIPLTLQGKEVLHEWK